MPTDDQERADAFRSSAQQIILTWMRDCRIKTPMSDVPDVLMHLAVAITDELEKTYQASRRSNPFAPSSSEEKEQGSPYIGWPQEGYHNDKLEPFDTTKYEYDTTENQRKGNSIPPFGDGWEELDWRRWDYTEDVFWRRLRQPSST